MSVEAWTITPEYTISGTGPYLISHPYVTGAIRAYIQLPTGLLQLNGTEFAVSPEASETTGNLTLSPTVATTYAGLPLIIDRMTPDEQGWLAVLGEREAGLAAQLDRMVQATQELRARGAGALRTRTELEPFDWAEGTVPMLEGGKPKSGPTATAIAAAQANALAANQAKLDAEAARDEAITKENSMLRDRGAWAGGILYSLSDIFTFGGSAYITQTPHIATTVAADLAAGRIRIFVAKGDAGAGTGDMLKTENLSGLTNYPLARSNMGLGALATKAQAAFADIDPTAVITDVETLAANKVANALVVAKAVTDYVDPQLRRLLADKTVTGAPVSALDFTEFNNLLWRYYEYICEDVLPVADATTFQMLFSSNGGVSYDNSAGNYGHAGNGASSAAPFSAATQSDTQINLTVNGDVGNAANEFGVTGTLRLFHAGNAAKRTRVRGELSYETAPGGNTQVWSVTGRRLAAQDTDAVRFQFSSGNIAVGSRIRMYGFN